MTEHLLSAPGKSFAADFRDPRHGANENDGIRAGEGREFYLTLSASSGSYVAPSAATARIFSEVRRGR